MGNKILKIFHLAVMAVAFVVLAVFTVLHLRPGVETQMSKLYLVLYIILMVWAAVRVFTIAKELRKK